MCSDLFGYPNSEGPEPVLAISMTSLGSTCNDLEPTGETDCSTYVLSQDNK